MNTTDAVRMLMMSTGFATVVVGVLGWMVYFFWIRLWLAEWGPADVIRGRGVFLRITEALVCVGVLCLVVWWLGWMNPKSFYDRWSSVFPSLRSDLAFIGPLWIGMVIGSFIGAYAGQFLAFRLFKKFRRVPLLKLKTEA